MKNVQLFILSLFFLISCSFKKSEQSGLQKEVERIVRTLSSDDMEGRAPFTPGIEKAASFIEVEFKEIGLKSMEGIGMFRQNFSIQKVKSCKLGIKINGKNVNKDSVFIISDYPKANYNEKSGLDVVVIKRGQNLFKQYQNIIKSKKPVLVLIDESYFDAFKNLRKRSKNERFVEPDTEHGGPIVFVLGIKRIQTFTINYNNEIHNLPLFNIVGIIPGKSKANELVIFSAHYDHLGIIKPNSFIHNFIRLRFDELSGDSIANGADDDATGVTALISLAKHFKKLNNNSRTLVFAAFTAEEIGNYGSSYFARTLNPSSVIAMFNIEMIGKNSRFGSNSAFITGYDMSNLGEILQRNLVGTDFKFYKDPYPDQHLFYRSDNVNFAELGIPAHTISTDQLGGDKFYHTVKDEFNTIDITNITATIEAIALSSRSIVDGTDSPRRIHLPLPKVFPATE